MVNIPDLNDAQERGESKFAPSPPLPDGSYIIYLDGISRTDKNGAQRIDKRTEEPVEMMMFKVRGHTNMLFQFITIDLNGDLDAKCMYYEAQKSILKQFLESAGLPLASGSSDNWIGATCRALVYTWRSGEKTGNKIVRFQPLEPGESFEASQGEDTDLPF